MVEEFTGTTPGDTAGKMQLRKEISSKLTNLQKKSKKHEQPQNAAKEQWIRATFAGAQYVINAPLKFAQIVLIECN